FHVEWLNLPDVIQHTAYRPRFSATRPHMDLNSMRLTPNSHYWEVVRRFGSRRVFDVLACKRWRLRMCRHILIELGDLSVRWPFNVGLVAGLLVLSAYAGTPP